MEGIYASSRGSELQPGGLHAPDLLGDPVQDLAGSSLIAVLPQMDLQHLPDIAHELADVGPRAVGQIGGKAEGLEPVVVQGSDTIGVTAVGTEVECQAPLVVLLFGLLCSVVLEHFLLVEVELLAQLANVVAGSLQTLDGIGEDLVPARVSGVVHLNLQERRNISIV